jgi:hypothetical protein
MIVPLVSRFVFFTGAVCYTYAGEEERDMVQFCKNRSLLMTQNPFSTLVAKRLLDEQRDPDQTNLLICNVRI